MPKKPTVNQRFVDAFNLDLIRLGGSAQIAVTALTSDGNVFEILDDESQFVTLFPPPLHRR